MFGKVISGKKLAENEFLKLKQQVNESKEKPHLAIVVVGNNPASQTYVSIKTKKAEAIGVKISLFSMDETVNENEIKDKILQLNKDPKVHGIILQLPLPKKFNSEKLINAISSKKDVDCLTYENLGRLLGNNILFVPPTAGGVVKILKSTNTSLEGLDCVIIGRSLLVGKPCMLLLEKENMSVTLLHSKSKNIESYTKKADVVVVAVGSPKMLTKDKIKRGSIIIDVGINRKDGVLCGDVDFDNVREIAGFITPVPGGVGPLTVSGLFTNLIKAYEYQRP